MSAASSHPPALVDPTLLVRYDANKKSAGIAYLLWFFLGMVGAHRFYFGRIGSAVTMLVVFLVSLALTVVLIGWLGICALAIWVFIDALLIPGMAQAYNNRLIQSLGG